MGGGGEYEQVTSLWTLWQRVRAWSGGAAAKGDGQKSHSAASYFGFFTILYISVGLYFCAETNTKE